MTLQEIANQFSIDEALAHQISHKKICVNKVSPKWVPEQLTEDQMASRVSVGKEHLGCLNHNENKVLNCNVTGDEMWVHYVEPKMKTRSEQWKRAGSLSPKEFMLSPSIGKVILVAIWDSCGIKLARFMPKG